MENPCIFLTACKRVADCAGVFKRWGTPWTACLSITGLSHRDKNPCTPTDNMKSPHVPGWWDEARAPEENPCRQGEKMQTPHRAGRPGGPSSCDATVLTSLNSEINICNTAANTRLLALSKPRLELCHLCFRQNKLYRK